MQDGHRPRAILDDDLRARAHSRHQRGKVARGFRLRDADHIFSHALIIHRFFRLNGRQEDCVLRVTSAAWPRNILLTTGTSSANFNWTMAKRPKPIVLTVLDGWGYRAETKGNAIALARKPNYDRLLKEFPNTLIHTSGPYVGLPEGQMGNSEVGHLNIGAGRIVQMDITRVDAMIASGEFFRQPLLLDAMERGRTHQLHLMGLVSDGGVHSHIEHLFALLRMARENKVQRVFVHCFMDGRDTPPESGIDFLRALEQKMREYGVGEIATVSGRYYAMDRDNRWERVGKAYQAIVHGAAEIKSTDPLAVMRASYEKGVTDEFVVPTVIVTKDEPGNPSVPRGVVRDDDAVIFFNFRADRGREMTRALMEPGFKEIDDPARPKNLAFVAMTQYDKAWPWLKYLIAPEKLDHILANVFAEQQFKN